MIEVALEDFSIRSKEVIYFIWSSFLAVATKKPFYTQTRANNKHHKPTRLPRKKEDKEAMKVLEQQKKKTVIS